MIVSLVDTNVLVYAYDPTDGDKRERAILILEELEASQSGALSAQILGEFFWTVTRKIPSPVSLPDAETSVGRYIRSWVTFDLTPYVVLEAVAGVRRFQLQYWDALIWATAKLSQVPYILSEDFTDGRLIEGVRFLNPFVDTFDLALLQM